MNLFLKVKKIVRKNTRVNNKALPHLFFFSDRRQFSDIFATIKLLKNASAAIIIREYDLDRKDRGEFAKKIIKIAKSKSLPVLIGKDLKLALELGADGVHFSDHDQKWYKFKKIPLKKNFIFTCSIHAEDSLRKAEISGFDAIFYSPIFTTKTHPNQKPAGVKALTKIALKSKIPLYALGGITPDNIRQLRACKINGIGGISIFNSKDK